MTTFRLTQAGLPSLTPEVYQIGRTTRAAHLATLVQAVNEALHQSPGQCLQYGARRAGVWNQYYWPSTPTRYLKVAFGVGWYGTYNGTDTLTIEVNVTDTLGNTYAAPDPLDGSVSFSPLAGSTRQNSVRTCEYFRVVDAMITAGLDATVPWRVEVETAETGGTVRLEYLTVEELPRWVVDDSEAYGVLPGVALPVQPIRDEDQLERLLVTLEHAETSRSQTHLCLAASSDGYYKYKATSGAWAVGTTYADGDLVESGGVVYRSEDNANTGNDPNLATNLCDPGAGSPPWWNTVLFTTTSNGADASLLNLEEASGDELTFWTRARKTTSAGKTRCIACVRYRVNGNDASLTITTGEGAYTVSLPDTTGAWADAIEDGVYLDTGGAGQIDTIKITGHQDGTHQAEVCAVTIFEWPEV